MGRQFYSYQEQEGNFGGYRPFGRRHRGLRSRLSFWLLVLMFSEYGRRALVRLAVSTFEKCID